MDCSAEFARSFCEHTFPNFNAFNEALIVFQKASGTAFKLLSSTLFPEGTLERKVMNYRYMRYVCIFHKKTGKLTKDNIGCPARFSVGTRHGSLRIVKYDMLHNHDRVDAEKLPQPGSDIVEIPYASSEGVDCSAHFQRVFQSLSFASFSDLQAKMDEFQRVTGSLYARRNTKRFPVGSAESKSLVYRSFAYECYHYGSHKSGSVMQRNRRSAKIGCRSKIYVSCSRNMLKIVRYDVRHNHGVTPDEAKLYPRNRRLTQSQLSVVEDLLETTQENNVVKEFIETNFDTSVTMSDVRNIKSKIKVSREQISQEFMISKVHPRLDELQCLTTSGNRSQFFRRLHCLTSLIEFWRNGVDVDIVPRVNSNDNVCDYEGASAGDPPPASAFGNIPTGRHFHDAQGSPTTVRFNNLAVNSACEFVKEEDEYELKSFDNRRLDFTNLRNAWP